MKEAPFFRLVFFIFFLLILSSEAVPFTRIQRLGWEVEALPELDHKIAGEEYLLDELHGSRRMDLEVNDYQGSGANNSHDPPKG